MKLFYDGQSFVKIILPRCENVNVLIDETMKILASMRRDHCIQQFYYIDQNCSTWWSTCFCCSRMRLTDRLIASSLHGWRGSCVERTVRTPVERAGLVRPTDRPTDVCQDAAHIDLSIDFPASRSELRPFDRRSRSWRLMFGLCDQTNGEHSMHAHV
jgi:hypothetical protein